MRLGPPVRGIAYGTGMIAALLAWTLGHPLQAVAFAVLVLVGLAGEMLIYRRR